MDDQLRTHCRVDLHKLAERIDPQAAATEFIRRWGQALDELLLSQDTPDALECVRQAEADANEAEAALSQFKSVVRDEVTAIDRIADSNEVSASTANKLLDISTRLESSL